MEYVITFTIVTLIYIMSLIRIYYSDKLRYTEHTILNQGEVINSLEEQVHFYQKAYISMASMGAMKGVEADKGDLPMETKVGFSRPQSQDISDD